MRHNSLLRSYYNHIGHRFIVGATIFITLTIGHAFSQASPEASVVAQNAIAALTNKAQLVDVTLTGNVVRTIGPDTEEGNGTFLATASGESRVDLTFGSAKTSEIRSLGGGYASGTFVAKDGKATPLAGQNCLSDPAWFFPAFTSISTFDPTIALSYVGIEQRGGADVYHLRSYQNSSSLASQFNGPENTPQLVHLSATDIYLDGHTFLPVAIVFNAHPDNDSATDIPVEIDYSSYQAVDGIMVPFHIQKYYQGVLLLDFAVTNVAVNTGLTQSNFIIQ